MLYCAGGMLMCTSTLFRLGGNNETWLCLLRPWTFHVTFSFMFASIFVKIYRAWRIFDNKSLRAVKLTPREPIVGLQIAAPASIKIP